MRTVSSRLRRMEYSTRSFASLSNRSSCIGVYHSTGPTGCNSVRCTLRTCLACSHRFICLSMAPKALLISAWGIAPGNQWWVEISAEGANQYIQHDDNNRLRSWNESRFQRCIFERTIFLRRCPRLQTNSAPLALDTWHTTFCERVSLHKRHRNHHETAGKIFPLPSA